MRSRAGPGGSECRRRFRGLKRSRPGRADEPAGPACWARAGEGKGRLGRGERVLGWLGRGRRKKMGRGERMGWVVLGLGPLSISISFSFANSHKLV